MWFNALHRDNDRPAVAAALEAHRASAGPALAVLRAAFDGAGGFEDPGVAEAKGCDDDVRPAERAERGSPGRLPRPHTTV